MTFERTYDWELIKAIMTHPKCWVADDFSGDPKDFEPRRDENLWYVLVRDHEGMIAGLYILAPQNTITWEIHTRLLPVVWGVPSVEIAWRMQDWIAANTPCRRIVTTIPSFNLLALRYAKKAGMTVYGVNPDSYSRGGRLHPQVLLGITCHS